MLMIASNFSLKWTVLKSLLANLVMKIFFTKRRAGSFSIVLRRAKISEVGGSSLVVLV